MGKPIEIPFLANVWNALKGFRSLSDGLDEVGDSLDDVARDARRAGDEAGDGLASGVKAGAREADRAASALDFSDVAREGGTSGDQAGDGLASGVKAGAREADRAASALDFSDVAREGETWGTRAGDGLADGITSGVQDAERATERLDFDQLGRDAQLAGERAGDGLADGIQEGVQDAERATERLDFDQLGKDAERAGERAGEGLSDGIKDGAKDAERSTERLEKSFLELRREAGRAGTEGGKDLGDGMKAGADRASDGVREIGDEAASTAKEAAASFDGSAASIGDAFQEVAANAFAGFGPAGLIAGVAAAAGIGVVITKLQEGGEDAEAFKAKVGDLTSELIDAGNQGGPSLDYLVSRLKEMAAATEDGEDSLSDLYKLQDAAASSFERIAQAYAGNADGLDELIEKEKAHQRSLEDEAAQIDTTKETSYRAALTRAEDSAKIVAGLERARDVATEAADNEAAYAAANVAELEAKAERTREYADSIQGELSEVGESWEKYQNAETGAIDLAAYTAALATRIQQMADYRTNMALLHGDISTDAYNYLVQMGADAAPLIDAYVKAPLEQKQATAAVWDTLGRTGGSSYNTALQNEIPDSVSGPKVIIPSPDMSPVERAIQTFGTRRIVVNVEGRITKIGQQVYD
ncbi:hypothetical protein [Rathayibacter sp. AY1A7]|uniref:hypothetical protein n=1 Tax=Rathayibacter sp. AY1A7 TaxID=2080524 RepID=UPI000CE937F2|nr:hypothetical protein [Rathayibacter sp. AY1A7]PPF21032.1 hypothetical protein C5B95_06375 [Rathayibacter sp. AY1A7]